ncbi:aldehyde dehydrogenase family protein [Alteromonas sp. C1M14]|uniref:aldehyde dehydrogenase family protein n=1 Tax=Alteromonas sp. C1M14 TaxID=2841567 RepID=UPI001C082BF5|nr:aldehyde dehydrogenase family protein [Alteromonas sp. C1M14]MBU2980048.1 aldehyde dehydrogenase family protein [Alteromonas sp. C1M14]
MTDSILNDGAIPAVNSGSVKSLLATTPNKQHYINGGYQAPNSNAYLDTCDPATGQKIAAIANGNNVDVDTAVTAARQALSGPWSSMTPLARSGLLLKVADLIDANMDELCELEVLDQGKPYFVARWAEIPGVAAQFRYFAGQVMALEGNTINTSIDYQPEGKQVQAWTLREPVGVVAAITPWNSPLILTAMKLAPAMAAGCTIVLKPAELTSLSALRLAELISEAGVPDGVVNVVTGEGKLAGNGLVSHPGIDKIAFTGSTQTGKAIVQASQQNLARVTLELGGKSPAIVLPDADLTQAIPGIANGIFFNGGQVCVANSRVYIHRTIFDEVVDGIIAYAESLTLGHGLDQATQMGPMVSTEQAIKIEQHIQSAQKNGAKILTGGKRFGPNGTFIAPTVITNTTTDMPVHCEEVFGPVLVAEPYDDIEEALAWSNDNEYGLAASVWTQDLSLAHRLSKQLQAGTVWINTTLMFDPSLPIGGMKQSGYGRDSGKQALDNYLEWKTVCAVL